MMHLESTGRGARRHDHSSRIDDIPKLHAPKMVRPVEAWTGLVTG